jgi:hypothetical protein
MKPEERDWIDRAISRDGMWEPPAHFVERVAVQALQQLPAGHVPRRQMDTGVMARLRVLFDSAGQSLSLHIHGSLWVLRQYRELLLH